VVRPAVTSAAALPAGVTDPATGDDAGVAAAGPTVRIMAVGDVMLGRSIGKRIRRDGRGVVFAAVRGRFADADLVIANLEGPITTSRDTARKHYTFRAPPAAAESLRLGHVDIVSVANNHAMDQGEKGLLQTLELVDAEGIATIGGGADRDAAVAPVIVERNGLRIAVLGWVDAFAESTGFNTREWRAWPRRPGVAIATTAGIERAVRVAAADADIVIAVIHAGIEYAPSPNAEQRAYADAALRGGAALVIGHHPHVLQGGTRRGDRYVAWSLGNFVFDRMGGASETAILDVTLGADGVRSVRWIPVHLDGDGLPVPG
jgi:poly-gamma-glutamate synthesis protein (capsule biosynthesis protein)